MTLFGIESFYSLFLCVRHFVFISFSDSSSTLRLSFVLASDGKFAQYSCFEVKRLLNLKALNTETALLQIRHIVICMWRNIILPYIC
jgi:hypothetical protein